MAKRTSLAEKYDEINDRIAAACERAGRDRKSVALVAVTKYAAPEQVRELVRLGHQDFAENYVQPLVQRASQLNEFHQRRVQAGDALVAGRLRWHMIGHLQRNKAKKVIPEVRLIHSVDSLRLAEELQACLVNSEKQLDVLVQVNCSGEESKYGCHVPAAIPLAEQIDQMYSLRVRGLMTIAPYSENPEDARPVFARGRELFEEIRDLGVGDGKFNLLSMGMSGDYEVALEEGANVVRVGSAIFGERELDDEAGDD